MTECSYRPRIISWTFINLALAFVLFIGDSVNKDHYLIFEAPIQNCFGVFHCNSSPPLLAVATALYIKLILTSMFRQKLHLLQKEKKIFTRFAALQIALWTKAPVHDNISTQRNMWLAYREVFALPWSCGWIDMCTSSHIMLKYKVIYLHPQVSKPQDAFFPCW